MTQTTVQAVQVSLTRSELTAPGIQRRRCGRGFRYFGPDGTPLADKAALARIKALVIPPAWEDVWICPQDDGTSRPSGPTPPGAGSTGTTTSGARNATRRSSTGCWSSAAPCRTSGPWPSSTCVAGNCPGTGCWPRPSG
jgi:hypothetical protein